MTDNLKYFLQDIRHLKLFPKRYKLTHYGDEDYWDKVAREYWNFKKSVECSDFHWYVITYKDGREELAYFRVWYVVIPHGGRLCRGIIPRLWRVTNHEHVKDIRIAF